MCFGSGVQVTMTFFVPIVPQSCSARPDRQRFRIIHIHAEGAIHAPEIDAELIA